MSSSTLQGEFTFQAAAASNSDGYAQWIAARQLTADAAAAKLNLPLGHRCEVWLRNGIRLRGVLRLVNEILFIEENRLRELPLTLDHINFKFNEMDSCLRLD